MTIENILNSPFVSWMEGEGPESDIVITSRVRLARNLMMYPFPNLLNSDAVAEEVMDKIQAAVAHIPGLELVTFDQVSDFDRQILLEKHMISPEHADHNSHHQGLITNDKGSVTIMVNEEDHLRIQCLLPGLQLEAAHHCADTIDNQLEEHLDFAFDERRGYLTACPTNVGTGIRASVMLHLPAISMTNQQNAIFAGILQLGLAVRGLYGEGTQALGNYYQISNQITLGQNEEDILNNLWTVTLHLLEQERGLRERLYRDMKYQLEDRVWRSYGLLTHARLLTSQETMSLLSDIRLGVDLGILPNIPKRTINELMIAIRPAHLQRASAQEMDTSTRDLTRAEVIKQKLRDMR